MAETSHVTRKAEVVEDQAIREQALDISQSFIVRAPAGSGKTRLLIQRYLALLGNVDEPEEIVAITFTRKAAAEMRERVLTALAAAADGSAMDDHSRRLALAALAHDRQRGWQLMANASRLRIQTIDSLNASLTRQMPMASRFGAQPESVDDASALYDEAAQALLREIDSPGQVGDDIATLLAHLDNNLLVARGLVAQMLRSRDHWLRNLPRMRERDVLEAALARARAEAIADVSRMFPPAEIGETLYLVRFAGQRCPESRTSNGVSPLESIQTWPLDGEESMPQWLALANFFLTQSGSWRKRGGLNKNLGFPAGENKAEKAEFGAAKDRMGALLERLANGGDGERLATAFDRLRSAPPGSYSERQWEVLGAIVRLLPRAAALLWTVFGQRGQCDFTEIAQSAVRALGPDDAPSDLALALDYRIRHLLIDEFQDTSFAQFELLEKLTRGWTPDGGCTLLAVGDPMQSIYRFREAEVGLFLAAMQRGIGGVQLRPLALRVNFRSMPGVVEWVNTAFSSLMPASDDSAAGRVPYTESRAYRSALTSADATLPAVVWHPHYVRREDGNGGNEGDDGIENAASQGGAEARRVIEIITSTRKERAAARIAILVRNRSHLLDIVPAMKAAGLAFQAVDIDPLQARPVVQDLLSLMRALLHPADRIAWFAILRAPWCGLSIDDLARLTGTAQALEGALLPDARTVWEMVADDQRVHCLSATGQVTLRRFREVMTAAIAMRRRTSLRELVERTWLELAGPACVPDVSGLDDANQLLALIESEADRQTGGSNLTDVEQLMVRVQKLYGSSRADQSPDQAPPVQIMTIHKAKGLEFDTVILPGLHRAPRQDDRRLLAWTEQAHPHTGERELIIAPIREAGGTEDGDAIFQYVGQLEKSKQQQEDIRLLYVAATRAERRLHLLASVTVKAEGNGDGFSIALPRASSLLAAMWPVAEPSFAGGIVANETATVAQPALADRSSCARRLADDFVFPALPPALRYRDSRSSAAPAPAVDFEWAGNTARHVGTLVHAYLQLIADQGLEAWSADRVEALAPRFGAELLQLGVANDEVPSASRRVIVALQRTLADERGRWILSPHHDARAEWRLTGVVAGRLVSAALDRTFVDEHGTRWIIDFKTGSHDGGDTDAFLNNEQARYRSQLATYALLVRAIQFDSAQSGAERAVKLALYFPLLSGWREWNWMPDAAM